MDADPNGPPTGLPPSPRPAPRFRLLPLSLLAALGLAACGPSVPPPDEAATVRFVRVDSGAPVADAYSTPSASWADVDADGDEDLYVLNGYGSLEAEPVPQPAALFLSDGRGAFTKVPASHPLVRDDAFSGSATWGDWDNDGHLDVFVANQRGADNFLFRGDGAGSFERVEEGPVATDGGRSFSAVWVDVDTDGWLDLHVLNGRDGSGGEEDFLYRNRGDGGFERVTGLPFVDEALASGGAAWGDYDGDGDPDVFLPVYATGGSLLYRNDGGWAFTEVTGEAGLDPDPLPAFPETSVAHWVDVDDDGDLDLFVGSTGGYMDLLYENRDGRFRRVTAGRVGLDATYVSDAAWGDVDDDGDLDLVVAAWGGASELYLNDGAGAFRPADGGELGDVVAFASSVSLADVEGDGDLDVYLTQWPINDAGGAPNLLYRNETEGGNWLDVHLEGRESNRAGVGAAVVVTTGTGEGERRQTRVVDARSSWRSSGSLTRHFGLGGAGRVREIEVRWPSGVVDRVPGPIEANRRVTIVEGVGMEGAAPPGG